MKLKLYKLGLYETMCFYVAGKDDRWRMVNGELINIYLPPTILGKNNRFLEFI